MKLQDLKVIFICPEHNEKYIKRDRKNRVQEYNSL